MDSLHPEMKEQILAEVDDQFLALVRAINAMDIETWASFYSDTAFVSAIAGTDCYVSKFAWVEAIRAYFAARKSQRVTLKVVRIEALSSSLALLTSEENSVIEQPGGGGFDGKHVFTMLWEKGVAGWKIIHSHESWTQA
ncbi:YybH family protein [Desulfolutivibrio sulfoxidireducens]|uniref:YybH family protein n=1 Tax=Desulfolutivibrio sulfoxidireducens TaxID=2773299 RepID=UPI00159E5440|nr:nuclear transport factor 2 family protein [Desulfolutivibrio sulfoxidireducens]